MALQYAQPAAPADCAAAALPTTLVAEDCPESVNLVLSEVCALYIGLPTALDPTTWGTVDLTTIVGIEAAKTAGTIVYLPVVGNKNVPERTEVPIPRGMVKKIGGKYRLEADFLDLSITNYHALLPWQHGCKIRFAFEILGGWIFGALSPDKGIYAEIVSLEFPWDRGAESYGKAQIVIEWKAKTDPKAMVSPYSEEYVAP